MTAERAQELKQGIRFELSRRNVATAEVLCRTVLDSFPDDAECWNVIGVIAAELQLWAQAREAFQRALRADPGFTKAAENLAQLDRVPPQPPVPADQARFLVIKAWGEGFWSDVDHVLGQLLVAEITGRVPVVHWAANSRFGAGDGRDAFTLYFEPVSSARLADLEDRPDGAFWPPKWRASNLDSENVDKTSGEWSRLSALFTLARHEEIVVSDYYTGVATIAPWIPTGHPLTGRPLPALYRYLCGKYLKPRPEIVRVVDRLAAALFQDRAVLAVHARGTDKFVESADLAATNDILVNEANRWAAEVGATRVFVMSDSSALLGRFRDALGERLLTLPAQRSDTQVAPHFLPHDRLRLGREIMVDTYLALRAGWFLGNGESNVSAMIEHLRDWPAGRLRLLRPNLHYRRHLV